MLQVVHCNKQFIKQMWTDGAGACHLNVMPINLLSHIFLLQQTLWYVLPAESDFKLSKYCVLYSVIVSIKVAFVLCCPVGAFVHLPMTGEAALLSSPPECRNTSRASWSDMSIRSICSSMSTFTSMEDMLPIGSGYNIEWQNVSLLTKLKCSEGSSKGLSPGREALLFFFVFVCFVLKAEANWRIQAGFEMSKHVCMEHFSLPFDPQNYHR